MQRSRSIGVTAIGLGLAVLASMAQAQQPSGGRQTAAPGSAGGRGANAEAATRPALLFKEDW